MEDSKLLALHASLKAGGPAGGRGGLGIGKQAKRTYETSLPKNALYSRFVPAGTWKAEDDLIGADFLGKRMQFSLETPTEEASTPSTASAAPTPKGEAADGVSGKKRKRSEMEKGSSSSSSSEAAAAGSGATAAAAAPGGGKRRKYKMKKVLLDTLHLEAATSEKGRVKVKALRKDVVAAALAASAFDTSDDAGAEFDRVLAKLAKKGRKVVLDKDGKYASLPADDSSSSSDSD